MHTKTLVISINACWNIFNFRRGLIAALQQAGYKIVALAPADGFADNLRSLGVEVLPIHIASKSLSPAGDLLLFLRYLSALRRIRPKLFLAYTAKPNIYGSMAAQLLGIKVINNISGLGTAFIRRSWLTGLVSFLYRISLRRSHTVFFQNPEDRHLFLSRGLVRAEQARLLPGSGVNLDFFKSRPRPAAAGQAFTFLLVGRLLWDKGVREFAEAAVIVRRSFPTVRFQLLGFLAAANRTAVPRETIEEWVDSGLIEYLGSADDVRDAVARADCIVLPSYREGLPRSLLEAAAMAKPLIATDVPGCRHVVDHGRNGLLCEPASGTSLAHAMLDMLRMPAEARVAMGQASRDKVEAEFSEDRVIAAYREAIASATGA
jgi:glycosyltransferase involved in cell wall biosynthesis